MKLSIFKFINCVHKKTQNYEFREHFDTTALRMHRHIMPIYTDGALVRGNRERATYDCRSTAVAAEDREKG